MKRKTSPFQFVFEISLLILVLVVLVVGIQSIQSKEPASQVYPPPPEGLPAQAYPTPIEGLLAKATATSVGYPIPEQPRPTAIILTIEPTMTNPPIPTPIPTPVVTPIPVDKPPFIPDAFGKTQKPFWVIFWDGNQVWRVDDQGKEQELLIDTYQELGQWLTAYPMPGSDCCYVGKRVAVSPDGLKLALVTLDKEKITQKGEPFHFSTYVFDIQSKNADFVDYGIHPIWSPDGSQLAYIKQNEVWLYQSSTKEKQVLITGDRFAHEAQIEKVEWSPDGKSLLLVTDQSPDVNVELWLFDILGKETPKLLLPSTTYHRGSFSWGPDGQTIYYISSEGEGSGPNGIDNLWSVSIVDEKLTQLTRDMTVSSWSWSPDGKWLAISATRHYKREIYLYDIWLMNIEGDRLVRITSAPPEDELGFWSPDGTRLIFTREGIGIMTLSLESGEILPLGINPGFAFAIGSAR